MQVVKEQAIGHWLPISLDCWCKVIHWSHYLYPWEPANAGFLAIFAAPQSEPGLTRSG